MDEYIERESLIKKYDEKLVTDERMLEPQHVRWLIADFPAADVKPVVRGRWVNDSDGLPVCTACGEIALQRIFTKVPSLIMQPKMVLSNYCPNCGADMWGDDE